MRRICSNDSAHNAPGDHVSNEVIIHGDKTSEHGNSDKGDYDPASGHRKEPHQGKAENPCRVAGRKTAKIVPALERMEPVGSGANKRWVVMTPRFWPATTTNIAQTDTKLVRHDQTETGDEQNSLPITEWSRGASNK